jgi:hypothetical protein
MVGYVKLPSPYLKTHQQAKSAQYFPLLDIGPKIDLSPFLV